MSTSNGTRAKVKSSAYLQAWDQASLSRISSGGLRARTGSALAGYAVEVSYNANVYVFALQSTTTHEAYDAVDLDQWQFRVAPVAAIAQTGHDGMGLSRVQAVGGDAVADRGPGAGDRSRHAPSRAGPAMGPVARAGTPLVTAAPMR
jgi:hypothetical protein